MIQVDPILQSFSNDLSSVSLIILAISVLVISFMTTKRILLRNKNLYADELSQKAKVISKRTELKGDGRTRAYNEYFATFEFYDGQRLELNVTVIEYGALVEGDSGVVSFQGTKFLNFNRGNQ